jgi:hypothetical protein
MSTDEISRRDDNARDWGEDRESGYKLVAGGIDEEVEL